MKKNKSEMNKLFVYFQLNKSLSKTNIIHTLTNSLNKKYKYALIPAEDKVEKIFLPFVIGMGFSLALLICLIFIHINLIELHDFSLILLPITFIFFFIKEYKKNNEKLAWLKSSQKEIDYCINSLFPEAEKNILENSFKIVSNECKHLCLSEKDLDYDKVYLKIKSEYKKILKNPKKIIVNNNENNIFLKKKYQGNQL